MSKKSTFISVSVAVSFLIFAASQAWGAVFKTSHRFSGFSTDSRHYIYLESYRNPATDLPKARLQIVNVPGNTCVQNGCIETEYAQGAENLTPKTAENNLLAKTQVIRSRLRLNRLKVGNRLAPLTYRRQADGSELYTFRLNNRNPQQTLQVLMLQQYQPSVAYGGNADVDRAALQLEVLYNNRRRTLSSLNDFRNYTMKYTLREVRLSPNGKNVVILFNVLRPSEAGAVQTTWVQSFPLS